MGQIAMTKWHYSCNTFSNFFFYFIYFIFQTILVWYRVVVPSGVGFIHALYKWMFGHNKIPCLQTS